MNVEVKFLWTETSLPRKIQDFISFDLFLGTFDWLIGKCTDCFCQFGADIFYLGPALECWLWGDWWWWQRSQLAKKGLDSMSRTFSSKSDQFVISRYDRIEMSGPPLPPTGSAIFPQFCQNFTFHKDLSWNREPNVKWIFRTLSL